SDKSRRGGSPESGIYAGSGANDGKTLESRPQPGSGFGPSRLRTTASLHAGASFGPTLGNQGQAWLDAAIPAPRFIRRAFPERNSSRRDNARGFSSLRI